MNKIEIIPAIDIIEGKCVRLTQGDYQQKKVYNDDPLEVAKMFESHGIKRLHVVDLDGARSKHVVNHKVVERIAASTDLTIDFGGGIKSEADIDTAFASGASYVTVGSVAVTDEELFVRWIEKYGVAKLILGADAKDGHISINGWKEESEDKLLPFIEKYMAHGINNVLCTDISKDGMLQGPSVRLYGSIMERHPDLHLIASGGVSSIEDIVELRDAGIPAVVFGKAVYEGRIRMEDLEKLM
ncbi:MAG: 1-(5-phosphoribosyl)-5-[(5-phosphoribosylamino)methylideneamino]imidazole-4-carboxamide isomerase [Bacteroides sp.]|nr:1-(5-phosphoribosyl)-5-[(5-phosphoribosylamino)methylideneamino]imidazole-4-carboxamide isomerase [Roseburia sp.]MCM1345850.1 1-(5-phosphoribosyl)-5-[(5-phosphoribosylamino)methylideneamino]imidazole-4-carboxamide isomerase [Bacteroides sp.]MCM1420240.1 1-(5-phosphoribosyl)-5-[(5-phosphoribosylamino)methylideneamino]imidazole-4-carboxamide isomerase [Bacteroides sp.]